MPPENVAARPAPAVRALGSNAPLLLNDPALVWCVVSGTVDVFAVPFVDGIVGGPREFLYQVTAGNVLFGHDVRDEHEVVLLAVGDPDTTISEIALADYIEQFAFQPEAALARVDAFVRTVSSAVAARATPRYDVLLEPDANASVRPGSIFGVRRDMSWISLDSGTMYFTGRESLPVNLKDSPFPLVSGVWLKRDDDAIAAAQISAVDALDAARSGSIWNGLRAFQRVILAWSSYAVAAARQDRVARLKERVEADDSAQRSALDAMAGIMGNRTSSDDRKSGTPLLAAMQMVGDLQNIRFRAPGMALTESDVYARTRTVAHASSVGQRRVMLTPRWWLRDVGPLLGFLELRQFTMDGQTGSSEEMELVPVALVPTKNNTYELVNPETGSRSVVTDELAQHIAAFAVQFYRGFSSGKVALGELWRFVTFGTAAGARVIVGVGLAGAALGLLQPLLTAYLFDDVIPSAEASPLLSVFIALLVASMAGVAFELTRALAVLRLHTRVSNALQMAVIDRLLRLPLTFFRDYSTGDLGQRALGINRIGDELGSATVSTVLSSFVSAGSFVLLFYYSVPLAFVTVGVLAANVLVAVVVARVSLRYMRESQDASGKLSGLVLQLLSGVSKLRVSASEGRAYARWSNAFRRQQQVNYQVGAFGDNVEVFHAVLGIVSTIAIFAVYAKLSATTPGGLTTGKFLAFSSASGTFIAAGMALTSVVQQMLHLLPAWERARPVLDTVPEVDFYKPHPGELTGRIEVEHVSFSYSSDGPEILHDVSMVANPGEFVAIVGPSGSGKSTLLRILLGFETQKSGSVRFDGHDLSLVDVTAVRRQMGVVLQNSSLTAGDVYSNIVGAASLTHDDAWEAARMAGMEEDLRKMPMGLHTVVSEGGGAMSGGQRQRLLIARALVTKPRILIFDEATSALDNRTQRIVSESVETLHATRIVLAHRLSTIRNADRIYVMDAGRFVESGTFDELIALGGMFAKLAARQRA